MGQSNSSAQPMTGVPAMNVTLSLTTQTSVNVTKMATTAGNKAPTIQPNSEASTKSSIYSVTMWLVGLCSVIITRNQ